VKENGAKNWKRIAEMVPGRTYVQCLHRWQKVLNPTLVKGPWTEEEDRKVIELVKVHGPKKWELIASQLPGRIGKQCRERWKNHLDPSIKKGNWELNEDELILKLHSSLGNKWATIAKYLPGRTDNAVKNRFNSTLSRRLRQQKETMEDKSNSDISGNEIESNSKSLKEKEIEEEIKSNNISNSIPVNISLYQPIQNNYYYFCPGTYDKNMNNNWSYFDNPKEKDTLFNKESPNQTFHDLLFKKDFKSPISLNTGQNLSPTSILRKRKAKPLSHYQPKKPRLEKPKLYVKKDISEVPNNSSPKDPFRNKENIPPEIFTTNENIEHSLNHILNNEDTPQRDHLILTDTGDITLKVLQKNNEQYEGIKQKAFKLLSQN